MADGLTDPTERNLSRIGTGFGIISDLKVGADGNVYVVSLSFGSVFRIRGICPTLPDAACRVPASARRGTVALRRSPTKPARNRFTWRWLQGSATAKSEFGDPLATDTYAVCLYDAAGLRGYASVGPGGACDGRPCWTEFDRRFEYRDTSFARFGLKQLRLREGPVMQARIAVRGRGAGLVLPDPATLASPVTVQLHRRGGGVCFGAQYSFPPAIRNNSETFIDRAD